MLLPRDMPAIRKGAAVKLTRQVIEVAAEHASQVRKTRVILWRASVGFFDTDDSPAARLFGTPVAVVEPSGKVTRIKRKKAKRAK